MPANIQPSEAAAPASLTARPANNQASVRLVPLLAAAVKFVSGYALTNGTYELQRDEYLYLEYGRHLAWGYLEVPPWQALQAWLTQALGSDYAWVRFWPFLWGALTVYVVGRLAARLGGGWFAQTLACTCYLAGAFARLNFLFQPNSFEVLGFTLCLYQLVAYIQNQQAKHLYYIGLTLGLCLLNKYTTFFFLAGLLAALLLTPQRRIFKARSFWLAAALALLLWLPNLVWQLAHGLPFVHHMRLLHDSQLVHVSLTDFWKDQLLMSFPAVWVWVPGLAALLAYAPFRSYRGVAVIFTVGLLILTVLHGKSYYSLGYFPVLFSFGAVWWENLLQLQQSHYQKYIKPLLAALPLLIMAPLLPVIFPLYAPAEMQRKSARLAALGLTRWEDGKNHALPQDFADMLGWRELADKTYQAYRALPDSTRANTLILCSNYGQAGAINYYNRQRAMPLASSFNGSYLYWFPPRPARPFRHLLLIDDEPDDLSAYFQSWRQQGAVTNPYAREQGASIWVGSGPTPALVDRVYREHAAALRQWENQGENK